MPFLPHWPQMLGSRPIVLGLTRVLELLDRLGNPHLRLPPVVHFAGTNGKGSTIAFLRAMLEARGLRVHVYTSPHLLMFNERIVLAGDIISDDALYRLMEECRLACGEDLQPTFFEATTAAAFLAFSRMPADVLLLETGLGGRLDATNVVPHPALTVITPIAYDHMEYLGPNLALIAGEKAGILKSTVPCVVGPQTREAWESIENQAARVDAPLYACEFDWGVERLPDGFVFFDGAERLSFPTPSLAGEHQILNAATAIAAMKMLGQRLLPQWSLADSLAACHHGLTHARWLARMQRITAGRLFSALGEGYEVWVDGAHNPHGAQALRVTLDAWEALPTLIICGFTKGRSPRDFLSFFQGAITHCIGAVITTEPSALSPDAIGADAAALSIPFSPADSIEEAFAMIPSLLPRRGRIVIAGSLYLASDFLKAN